MWTMIWFKKQLQAIIIILSLIAVISVLRSKLNFWLGAHVFLYKRNVTVEDLVHKTIQNYTGTQTHIVWTLDLDKKCVEEKGSVTYEKGQHHKNTSASLPLASLLEVSGKERDNSKCTKTVSVEMTEVTH